MGVFSFIIIFLAIILLIFLSLTVYSTVKIYTGKSINDRNYPPVHGYAFGQLLYFNRIHDYFAEGEYNQEIVRDLLGEGIFGVDGDKWRQQRKLASFEFSTRVLRDFSCSVFRRNAAKLTRAVSELVIQCRALICKNTLIQEKVAQEIRNVTGCGREANIVTVDDFAATITAGIQEQMHFLHATVTETLRLYPAVPIDGRSVEMDDILPDGYRLKKGDGVYYMAYAMGRMPYIWGEDAEDFRPERWLKNGIFQPESPFKFIAFHAGPRICLGKDFAYR
ncbi:hypothetical protein SLEP1_g24035 [Rubroshorea leprosula]|uniref:Cytochrome P450 n=1 Tax=Rubroshorea leprosula TaxID=152421 RepID=A0AAV5JEB2_9ROSI|nr:hypothetical protein SLEP1_g24035 [Rubroshorea leprosula]